mmetsp:Transcript_18581/g.51872  ORF Transcript_18581/g.51872 Transcript_18581/m.51872 type:complete len:218 (+) Transcript_18581:91-744(+)
MRSRASTARMREAGAVGSCPRARCPAACLDRRPDRHAAIVGGHRGGPVRGRGRRRGARRVGGGGARRLRPGELRRDPHRAHDNRHLHAMQRAHVELRAFPGIGRGAGRRRLAFQHLLHRRQLYTVGCSRTPEVDARRQEPPGRANEQIGGLCGLVVVCVRTDRFEHVAAEPAFCKLGRGGYEFPEHLPPVVHFGKLERFLDDVARTLVSSAIHDVGI